MERAAREQLAPRRRATQHPPVQRARAGSHSRPNRTQPDETETRSLPSAVIASGAPASALTIGALTLSGLDLQLVPARLTGQSDAFASQLVTVGHLLKAGVLPLLAPKRQENTSQYLCRLSKERSPLDSPHYTLKVKPYEDQSGEDIELAEKRSERELVIVKGEGLQCQTFTCLDAAEGLGELHPYLLGSLLAHLSHQSLLTWPVYTAWNALQSQENWTYFGSVPEYWKSIQKTLRERLGRKPTREEVKREAGSLALTPAEFKRKIGLAEVIPAVSHHKRLSYDEMLALAATCPSQHWASALRICVMGLRELEEINRRLAKHSTDEDRAATLSIGEFMPAPLCCISAGEVSQSAEHLVEERLNEDFQMAYSSDPGDFMPNILVRVNSAKDARRAKIILKCVSRSLDIILTLIGSLVDEEP